MENAGQALRLRIRFASQDITLRDLAAYVTLLDGAYGRTDPRGYRSYAQRPPDQLSIEEIHSGSSELELIAPLVDQLDAWRLVFVYLVVRTGPSILKGKAAKNWTESVKTLGEAVLIWRDVAKLVRDDSQASRLPRGRRTAISKVIESDARFDNLNDRDRRALVSAVEEILFAESGHLPAAARFSEEKIREIALEIVELDNGHDEDE